MGILDPPPKAKMTVTKVVARAGSGFLADYYCDGTADQTEINSAITAVNGAGGGEVVIRPGTYTFNGQGIPKSNVTVSGEGVSTIIKRANSVDTILWRVNAVNNFTVRNMQIDGNKANHPVGATQQDIRIQDSTNLLFEKIYQHDATTHGIITAVGSAANDGIIIRDCRFENNGTSADGSGVYINGSVNVHIENVRASGCELDGIQWKTSTALEIINCVSYANKRYGFFAVDGHTNVTNCSSYNNLNQGFRMEPGSSGENTTVNLSNSDIHDNNLDGIAIVDCSGSKISNVKSYNNGKGAVISAGLKLQAQSTKTCSRNMISNCSFYDDQGTPTQAYGIWGLGAGTVDSNNVVDCQIYGITTTAVREDTWNSNNIIRNTQGANPDGIRVEGNLSGSKTLDRTLGKVITFTMVGNLTASLTSGKNRGDELILQVTQDSTGGRVLSWSGSNFAFSQGSFAQSSAANAVDIYRFVWNGTLWREIGRSLASGAVSWGGIGGTLSNQTDLQTALDAKESVANKGVASGYASLDGSGKVPSAQLPSFVDDVLEYANTGAFPGTGSTGVIYVAQDTNKVYRWTGSVYVEISPSPGSTDSVSEGSTNLYYTNARADARVAVAVGVSVQAYSATLAAVASGSYVSSITGTANQVNASVSTGGVTLSLPQSIATSSSPTFAGLNLGTGNISTMGNIAMDGESVRDITVARRATGAGLGLTIQAGGAQSGATNTAGGNLTLASGIATGSNSSVIIFATASTTGSGTTDKTPAERMRLLGNPNGVLLIGVGSTSATGPGTADGITFGGNSTRALQLNRHTTANTAGNSFSIYSGGATSGATDKAAGDLVLGVGLSTGTGASKVRIQTNTTATATGTSDNSAVDRIIVTSPKALTNNSAISLLSLTLASGSLIGGVISYTIEVTNGTDYQVETGQVVVSGYNKAGAFGVTVTEVNSQQNLSTGTLATTWAISSANPAVISVNANSSLTPSTGYPRITFIYENFGQQAVAVS